MAGIQRAHNGQGGVGCRRLASAGVGASDGSDAGGIWKWEHPTEGGGIRIGTCKVKV